MDLSNSMLGRAKAMDNHHIYKFFGFQPSGSSENSESMKEFNEEDIWGSYTIDPETKPVIGFQENGFNGVPPCRSMGKEGSSNEGSSNNRKRSVKIYKKESCHEGNNNTRVTRYRSSAPVNIPNWSQMVWAEKNSENSGRSHGISDDDGVKDFENLPPHEVIARQLALSGITSFSVYEGAGRTLKGRDLSRVRNTVWMRTGFIG